MKARLILMLNIEEIVLSMIYYGKNQTKEYVERMAESLQVAFDAGAKRILLPMSSVTDIPTVPGEIPNELLFRSCRRSVQSVGRRITNQ